MSGRPHMSAKVKKEKKKLLLDMLLKVPIIETACQKVEITRMMFYRWKDDDPDFTEAIEDALSVSRDRTNDLAESQLINKIKNGDFAPIRFWLINNCKRYQPKRPVAAENGKNSRRGYQITIVEERGISNIDSIRDLKKRIRKDIETTIEDSFEE